MNKIKAFTSRLVKELHEEEYFLFYSEPVLDDFCFLPKEMTFDDFCSILNLNDKELFCRNAFEKCYGIDLKYSIKCHKMHYTGTSSTFFIMLYCLSLTGSKLLIYCLFCSQLYINVVEISKLNSPII